MNRAIAKNLIADYQGAINDCNKVIQLNPNKPYAYLNRGIAKIMLKQYDSGCFDLEKAEEFGLTDAADFKKEYCK